jgi:tetratricopeptide (TPR) repeat protein
MRRCLIALVLFAGACAPLAREHQADAAFRSAIGAQLAYDDARAETLYRDILALGFDWSPVWNNLAVIQVHKRQYQAARRLLAHAVAANDLDVVALTNYGVISYHLSDYAEARRTLEEARRLRARIIDSIPSDAARRTSWEEDQYARATAPLEETAKRYLARIDAATISDAPLPAVDLMADLHVVDGHARF